MRMVSKRPHGGASSAAPGAVVAVVTVGPHRLVNNKAYRVDTFLGSLESATKWLLGLAARPSRLQELVALDGADALDRLGERTGAEVPSAILSIRISVCVLMMSTFAFCTHDHYTASKKTPQKACYRMDQETTTGIGLGLGV
jgi:hypothetical protein